MKGQRWEEELEARCKDWADLEESRLLAVRSDPALISTDCSRHCSLSSVPSPSPCVVCESGLVGFVMTRGKGAVTSLSGGRRWDAESRGCLFISTAATSIPPRPCRWARCRAVQTVAHIQQTAQHLRESALLPTRARCTAPVNIWCLLWMAWRGSCCRD